MQRCPHSIKQRKIESPTTSAPLFLPPTLTRRPKKRDQNRSQKRSQKGHHAPAEPKKCNVLDPARRDSTRFPSQSPTVTRAHRSHISHPTPSGSPKSQSTEPKAPPHSPAAARSRLHPSQHRHPLFSLSLSPPPPSPSALNSAPSRGNPPRKGLRWLPHSPLSAYLNLIVPNSPAIRRILSLRLSPHRGACRCCTSNRHRRHPSLLSLLIIVPTSPYSAQFNHTRPHYATPPIVKRPISVRFRIHLARIASLAASWLNIYLAR